MVTLSGSHTSPAVNYYNHDSISVDIGSVGFAPGSTWTFTLQATSYTGVDQIGYAATLRRPEPDTSNCFHWTGITPSSTPLAAITYPSTVVGSGVEWTGASSAIGCLDFTRMIFEVWTYKYPGTDSVTWNWTLTFTPGTTAAPCQYGTRAAASTPAIAAVTDAMITTALLAFGAPWMAYLFAPLVGYAIDSGVLCGSGPPAMPTVTSGSLLSDIGSRIETLNAVVWYSLCECVPGTPPPTPYTPPVVTKPPGWQDHPTYTCSEADICTTLALILKRLDQLSTSQNISITNTTTVNNGAGQIQYKTGRVHSGLSNSGSFPITRLVGLRVELLTPPPSIELAGNPPYLWDVGWMSMSDGGAMLQEKRITRTSMEWFPAESILGTVFGYYANPGVVLQVTELLPAA